MAYVRVKRFGDRAYYYLVEKHRDQGKWRQRLLKYLGKKIHEEYLGLYRKRKHGPRVGVPENPASPTGLAHANHGTVRGTHHGGKKNRPVLPD
ncbi:MAG: hypothetical protein JRJ26_20730 [Deltaproteobacteria bacterium]|nr:hypothetical protein [Deltaproteobacteria bacterium]